MSPGGKGTPSTWAPVQGCVAYGGSTTRMMDT